MQNNYILIGKISSTHGIKGEIKILSNFEYKNKVFKINNKLYIGPNYEELTVNSYRVHKGYDMILFKEYSNINDVLKYMKMNVYIKKSDLSLNDNELLDSDYIGMKVIYNNNYIGNIIDYKNITSKKKVFVIKYKVKEVLVPFELIDKIDINNKSIYINYLEGLFE